MCNRTQIKTKQSALKIKVPQVAEKFFTIKIVNQYMFFRSQNGTLANSANFGQMPQNEASDLGFITKTRLYNFDPFKPHFYIVKLGFTGVYIIFLISVQNIDCGTR